jgi:exopolysaccharide biosynthesis predicted pyruvyltransferase EpsI
MDLRSQLKSLEPRPLYYKPNPGNGGDALIAHATYRLFEQEGIDYRIWRAGDDAAGKVILYGGGGNFIDHYDHCASFVAEHHRRAKQLVILPHTIQGHAGLLSELGENVSIFCREQTSYEYVVTTAKRARVWHAEDLALELDAGELLAPPPRAGALPKRYRGQLRHFRRLRRRLRARQWLARRRSSGEPRVLNCFREDVEQTSGPKPRDNLDLSQVVPVDFAMLSLALAHYTSHLIFDFIERYDMVRSNRLHIGLAAALAGKRVEFYANSYWKNQAVYEQSFARRFPMLSWKG